jgi:PII-like signaling protein
MKTRSTTWRRLHDSIMTVLLHKGVSGAKGHQHKESFFHVSKDMPIMVSVIDCAQKIATAAEAIEGMLEDGLNCYLRGRNCAVGPQRKIGGGSRCNGSARWDPARSHISEADRDGGRPLYEAIVAKRRELKIAGVTVFRGLEGNGETAEMHKAHLVHGTVWGLPRPCPNCELTYRRSIAADSTTEVPYFF